MRRHRLRLIGILTALAVSVVITQNCVQGFDGSTGTQNGASTPVTPPSTVEPTITRTDFMTGLSNPWDMAFTADGAMFFTERCNGLSVRQASGMVIRLFGTAGSSLVAADLFCENQSGMLGVAVDPDFATNRFVYVYMSSNLTTNPRTNRVVRLVVDANYTSVSNRTDIVTDIAYKDTANNWGGAGNHSGGRIRFNGGLLYITTGDNHNGTLPQDPIRLGGKVLRVDRNGVAAAGNNAPNGFDPRIFTYGHRNVQGITFRPTNNQPFTSEHGPGHTDEVTPLVAGGNAGWDPKPDAGVTCADNYCGYTSNKANGIPTPMTDTGKFPQAMLPIWTNDGNSQGTGPATFLTGNQWKAWSGRLLVGVMGATRIELLNLNANGTVANKMVVPLPAQRARAFALGNDGNLYVATDSGNIWRVVPQ